MKLSPFNLFLLIAYAVVCIVIGFWSGRRKQDSEYLIAGRKMSIVGFISSVVASYIGGAAIVAYSAYIYQYGISALAVFAGTAAGFLFFIPYAVKLRMISSQKQFLTLSDWFTYKFGTATGIVSAAILFVVYFGMLLNQFIAGSSILAHISGMSYESALFLSSSVITVYLLAGGFSSVIKTDIFQYIILFVLFILLAFILMRQDEGFVTEVMDFSRVDPLMTGVFILFGILIIFQSAEYWQRVYAAKSIRVVRNGLIGSAIFVILTGIAISVVGLASHHRLPGIEARNAFAEGLSILIAPEFIGVSLILLFAAIMSSADTIIFVLASSISKDYISGFTNKKLTDHKLKKLTRIFILVLAVVGTLLAFVFRDLIAVIVFITGIGFTIIPAAVASFHFNLRPVTALTSFGAGIGYIFVLILTGNLVPELSIASIGVSLAALALVEIFFKFTGHAINK